jgi:hypothetical protein
MQAILTKHWGWWSVGALIVLVLVYPAKLTVAPAYTVRLVDQFDKPMSGTAVSELWQQTSTERGKHLNQRTTDANGMVSFPAHKLRSALILRMAGCLAYLRREGLAASCGGQYEVSAVGDVKELARHDVEEGVFDRRHLLTLTLKACDPRQPSLC